jgi:hypothetical protein
VTTSLEVKYAQPTESLLGFADDTVDELRDRLMAAMRFTFSWMQAVEGSDNENEWLERIHAMQEQIVAATRALPTEDVFPRDEAAKLYETTSANWAALWRDLQLSADTLPRPDLLTVLGSYGRAVIDAPFAAAQTIAEQVAGSLGKALGGTVAGIWRALWPFLLVGGGIGIAYLFRAPLARLLGKVAK